MLHVRVAVPLQKAPGHPLVGVPVHLEVVGDSIPVGVRELAVVLAVRVVIGVDRGDAGVEILVRDVVVVGEVAVAEDLEVVR